jgi:hypothetical protein
MTKKGAGDGGGEWKRIVDGGDVWWKGREG